jgi:hypothetical protein
MVAFPSSFKVCSFCYTCGTFLYMLCPLAGSLISVWGTNNGANISNGWDPSYNCSVDNVSIATNPGIPDSNNQVFCTANLNDGTHVLRVNVSSEGQPFWLDGLHYSPSPTVSLSTAEVIVEQNDAALIYSPGWQALGPDAVMTLVNGAQCTFNFTGLSCS